MRCRTWEMGQCAIHRVFFLSTVALWLFATVYLLGSGSGNMAMKETLDVKASLNIMEELQRQNFQLKEIALKLSMVEIKSSGVRTMEKEGNGTLLRLVRSQLDKCMKKNELLAKDIEAIGPDKGKPLLAVVTKKESRVDPVASEEPGVESLGELTRSARNNILELWYSIKSGLTRLKNDNSLTGALTQQVEDMIRDLKVQKSSALIETELILDLERELQAKEMRHLQELVQKRIRYVQNPPDCDKARKLVCNINKGCGFGCQIHHVVFCFLVAFGTERTMILESANWRYSPEGWESVFLPVSKTCTTASGARVQWKGEELSKGDQVIVLSSVDGMPHRPPYLPLNIPEDLAPKLVKNHGNPPVWWIAQFVTYLMRPQPWLKEALEEFEKKIDFTNPVAGIHVRRTDKIGTEAAFHSISEYMEHVVDWFDKEDMKRQRRGNPKIETRKVYLATDEPMVLSEASRLYPGYKFLGDPDISKSAGTSARYSKTSLIGLIFDIVQLGKCDFLVGTFSSQVARVSYELMQVLHTDASTYAHSLDDIFYFGGQGAHSQKAIYDHKPAGGRNAELEMKDGDVVGIAGNHWDGYSKGTNRRTTKGGLYPSYKVKEIITTAQFPTYPGAENVVLEEDYIIK